MSALLHTSGDDLCLVLLPISLLLHTLIPIAGKERVMEEVYTFILRYLTHI